jgi:hypothetical protein
MSEKTKSFATSKTDYTVVQGRIKNGYLHIQGSGENVNRSYGVAVDFPVEADLADWMNSLNHPIKTLAGSDAMYFPLQYAIRENNIHFQVKGSTFNRSYGAAFNVDIDEVSELAEFAS